MTFHNIAETTLRIPGLAKRQSILQVTDSHLTAADDRDGEQENEHAAARTKVFSRADAGWPNTVELLESQVSLANEHNVDLVVFTGDIIDFPSKANLDLIDRIFGELTCPYLYTLGNHDWNFPFIGWGEEFRLPAYPAFDKWASRAPGCEMMELAGITVIAADNSISKLTAEQADTIMTCASRGPTLLFMHIPVVIPSLIPEVVSVWKLPIVMGNTPEELAAYLPTQSLMPDETTLAFRQWLNESPNVYGVFCGHVHFVHEDKFDSGHSQYVTLPGYLGGSRLITLLPEE